MVSLRLTDCNTKTPAAQPARCPLKLLVFQVQPFNPKPTTPYTAKSTKTSPPPPKMPPKKKIQEEKMADLSLSDLTWIDSAFPPTSQKQLNKSIRDALGTTSPPSPLSHRQLTKAPPTSQGPQILHPPSGYWQIHSHPKTTIPRTLSQEAESQQ